MKVWLVIGFVVLVTGFVVYALSASMAPAEYEDFDGGITGPLARGAVSRSKQAINLWTRPRYTSTRKEREEMFVGSIANGETFVVLNHHFRGGQLWVLVARKDDQSMQGWLHSPAADPVRASKLN